MKFERKTPVRKSRPADSPYSAGSPASSRLSQSPAMGTSRKRKSPKKPTPILDQPLSILTQHYEIPLKDISAWVHRPTEERVEEVRNNNGRIARPMNSFMLYRSAYAQRVKRFCKEDNHQIVSKVTGASWQIEPKEVREKYERFAHIERDHHQAAHPDYKFSPNKNGKKRVQDEDESSSEEEDGEWDGSSRSAKRSRTAGQDSSRSQSSTPFEDLSNYRPSVYHGMASYHHAQLHPSSYRASNPHGPEPRAYWQHHVPIQSMSNHFPTMEMNIDQLDDLHLSTFDAGHHLVGMPYANNQDLVVQTGAIVQPSPSMYPSPTIQSNMQLDPQLADFEPSYQYTMYENGREYTTIPRSHGPLYAQPTSSHVAPPPYVFIPSSQHQQIQHQQAQHQQIQHGYHQVSAPHPHEVVSMHPGDIMLTNSPTGNWNDAGQNVSEFEREFWA